MIPRHSSNQLRRSAAVPLHVDVVIELDGQGIDVGQFLHQVFIPRAEVGQVGQGNRAAISVARRVETKTEGFTAIVCQPERSAAEGGASSQSGAGPYSCTRCSLRSLENSAQ